MTLSRFKELVLSPLSIFLSADSGSDRVVGIILPTVPTCFHQFRGFQLLKSSTLEICCDMLYAIGLHGFVEDGIC